MNEQPALTEHDIVVQDEPAELVIDYAKECFLCRRTMGANLKKTKEDVFPKWLIAHAGLAGTHTTLPNGRNFSYGQRVVPCCIECNQFMSATLEAPVSSAFKQGYDAVEALNRRTLTLWLGKLFYGTRWRELAIRVNVADQDSPTFMTPDVLTGTTEYLRQLLLSGPDNVQFATPPASVFLYRAGIPTEQEYQFDFLIASDADVVAVRCGDIFVVAIFGDAGYWQEHVDGTDGDLAAHAMTLHPAQCLEILLVHATQASRLSFTGRWDFMLVGDGDPALPGGAERIFWASFTPEETKADPVQLTLAIGATLLVRGFNGEPTEALIAPAQEGRRPTCLFNEDGHPVVVTCYEFACPALSRAAGWVVAGEFEHVCAGCGATSHTT